MKLLTKINIRYLGSSLVIMILAGIVLYFVLYSVIAEQFDEKMAHTLDNITHQIEETGDFCSNPPFTEVLKSEEITGGLFYSDTTVMDHGQKHGEKFRQLTSHKQINGTGYHIAIRESKMESDDLLESVILVVLVTFIFLTLSLFMVNRQVARSIWLPFNRNLAAVKNFSLKKLESLSLSETGISEFNELNRVLNSLTGKIIQDYQSLKQFSEEASHEIQSPLAIINIKLEGLLNSPGLSKAQAEKLQSIYSSVHRLSRLNKDLLLLTKIENKQYTDIQAINMKMLVEERLEDFHELILLRDISLTTNFRGDPIFRINPALADLLMNNLLSNAINHSPRKADIMLEIDDTSFKIYNSGESAVSHPENIFNRFSKEDPSSRSVGLGLAIAKKICETYNIDIDYSFSENLHCFRLHFNL